MQGVWKLKAVRHGDERSRVRRPDGTDLFTGTAEEALDFAVRAQTHLAEKGVIRVEAWSAEQLEFDFVVEFTRRVLVFVLRWDGRVWIAEQNELHHGARCQRLYTAVNYALFRGGGRACAIRVLDKTRKVQQLILADQSRLDYCPTRASSLKAG